MEQVRASISGSDRVDLTYDEDSGSASAPAPVRHAVTLEAGKNGSLSADRTQVQSGEVVTLTVTPEKGYRLEKLEVRDGQNQVVKLTREEDGTYTFTMPESPVDGLRGLWDHLPGCGRERLVLCRRAVCL